MQGEPLTDVFVLIEGTLEVRVSGTLSTILPPFQLVGEASLLENLQSPGGSLQQAPPPYLPISPPHLPHIAGGQPAASEG